MNIEERMIRKNPEDIMEIGSALATFYEGPAGVVVRAMANAITMRQFTATEDNMTPADKKLGRAEGVNLLITDIEIAIDDMRRLTAEVKEEQRVKEG